MTTAIEPDRRRAGPSGGAGAGAAAILTVALCLGGALPVAAEPGFTHVSTAPAGRTAAAALIDRSVVACGRVPEDYRIPCIAGHLAQAGERVGRIGETSDVLEEAAAKVAALGEENADQSRRWRRIRSAGAGGGASMTLWPLYPEVELPARRATLRILVRAESRLLSLAPARRDAESHAVARALGRLGRAVRG